MMDLIALIKPSTTPLIVSHAPDQSPLIACITALMIPSTVLIAVSTIVLMTVQTVSMTSWIFDQAA